MFKVGDRVVVVENLHEGPDNLTGKRGEVTKLGFAEWDFQVHIDGYGHLGFMKGELVGEAVYDVLSAKPAEEAQVVSPEEVSYTENRGEDVVNSPSHYADGWSNGAEVIDITEHLNFNRGNAVKYLSRAGKKGGPGKELEDLQKALWYVTREVQRLGGTS
ncbi:DUF3310 domain-containing protein [Streptomyces ardesiacus]|uniref:DUF3310 domain-containing protein n=1 Tax=Streptomyces ardesiacus TaxID=285564 RepID=UPI003655CBF5